LTVEQADTLAAQLPTAVGDCLHGSRRCVRVSLVDFIKRVSAREHVYLPEAACHARAVVQVIAESVPSAGDDGMEEVLPDEWQPLVAPN
jgi:uncharacterized protein (DUF2267 family)